MDKKEISKIYLYSVIIEPCEEGGYFAYCPSLQGCHAEGDIYAEVIENIENVIKEHIKVRKEHNEFVPEITVKEKELVNINLPILVRN